MSGAALTTSLAVDAVAWGRAPRCPYKDGRKSDINRRVVCADGFKVSIQASTRHYANDSTGNAPYWDMADSPVIAYPFITFEIGNPSDDIAEPLTEYDSGGVWAWVPRQAVEDLPASSASAPRAPPSHPPEAGCGGRVRPRESPPSV